MKVIIWDFNGTILDDVRLSYAIETEMLKKRGMKTYTIEEYRDMFVFPVIDYYYKMGYTFKTETYQQVADEFNKAYDERFSSCPLMPGFLDLIHTSMQKGYRNVILSASRHDALVYQCKQLGIDHYFDTILGIDNNQAASKLALAKAFMAKEGLYGKDCMYIGDSVHDKECALAMGIEKIVLVASGHQSYKALKDAHDEVYHRLDEVELP